MKKKKKKKIRKEEERKERKEKNGERLASQTSIPRRGTRPATIQTHMRKREREREREREKELVCVTCGCERVLVWESGDLQALECLVVSQPSPS